ncbi:MAG: segregation/condensation protein A [Gammaproteobacteria bacterium HGW-Gammaproteobacteria-3]|nr:MAG: segregation/condensation protein A [Gammaproteobacteria bacterium HGW-Gammaproteobacteria-3]
MTSAQPSVLDNDEALPPVLDSVLDSSAILAIIEGAPCKEFPQDLYIPPDAMRVFLDTFEGPLDLLLYLIKRQNLDILTISIAQITRQYIRYIDMMAQLQLELAAEYLVMAALLAEIKSRMLLPRQLAADEDEEDPRAELIRRLQEYEQIKQAAEDIDSLLRQERDIFNTAVDSSTLEIAQPLPTVALREMLLAMKDVLGRAEQLSHHRIVREPLSVRERMSAILEALEGQKSLLFTRLFVETEGRHGVVVSFLAILELSKEGLVEIIQAEPFAPISISAAHTNTTVRTATATAAG